MDRLDEIVAERDTERSHCPDESCCLLCDTIEIALALRAELAEATRLITGEDTEERLSHLCKFGEAAKVKPLVRLCEKCGAEAGSSGSVSIDIWKRDRSLLAEARAELDKLREVAGG